MSDHPTPSPTAFRPRVLLVDDDALNREIIGRVLLAAAFDVDTAENGEDAVAATWGRAYDLVLMDIEMPGMNGFEAAARIRAREGVMSGVRIAALTATRHADAEQYSFWSGIDAFIAKPIKPDLLVQRVCDLLANCEPQGEDWKPVWRLAVFTRWVAHGDPMTSLGELSALLDAATAAIDEKRSFSGEFYRTMRALFRLSSRLGFEEIAGLCAVYIATQGGLTDTRCRDPNLIGAIDRARYAIKVYKREQDPRPAEDWWTRTRVNVQNLFHGRPPIAQQASAYKAFGAQAFPG